MIKKHFYSLLSVLVIFCTGASGAWAQALTESQVSRFLDSVPAMKQLNLDEQIAVSTSMSLRPFSASLEQMSPSDNRKKDIEKMAKKHGFKQAEDWAQTGDRVVKAYALLNMGMSLEDLEQTYNQAKQILNNPNLPPEMKQMLNQQFNSDLLDQFQSLKDSKPDIPAVKTHEKRLEILFKEP